MFAGDLGIFFVVHLKFGIRAKRLTMPKSKKKKKTEYKWSHFNWEMFERFHGKMENYNFSGRKYMVEHEREWMVIVYTAKSYIFHNEMGIGPFLGQTDT